jgi:hypothetical protein
VLVCEIKFDRGIVRMHFKGHFQLISAKNRKEYDEEEEV